MKIKAHFPSSRAPGWSEWSPSGVKNAVPSVKNVCAGRQSGRTRLLQQIREQLTDVTAARHDRNFAAEVGSAILAALDPSGPPAPPPAPLWRRVTLSEQRGDAFFDLTAAERVRMQDLEALFGLVLTPWQYRQLEALLTRSGT